MSNDATPAKVRLTDGLGPLLDSEEDPARLWAEIHTLRAAVAGPKGYATWREAATSERLRRVRKEQQIETLLRGITDARCLMDPIWRERMGAESVREYVQRGLRCIDSAVTDCQFIGHLIGTGSILLVAQLQGALTKPVPDMVLSDCMKALDYYRAGLEQRAPKWVPCRVLLEGPVRGDFPIGHTTLAEAGEHDCESNRYGAISVLATNGQMLGVKPAEFEPLEWRKNEAA